MSGYGNAIGWCDVTWPVIIGCFHASTGCQICWAERTAIRFAKPGQKYHGLVVSTPKGPKWTGQVRFWEPLADYPLRLRRPSRIFVCDTGDLFHERVPDEWIDRVFAVMACAPWHTFQLLTKRPERMRAYLSRRYLPGAVNDQIAFLWDRDYRKPGSVFPRGKGFPRAVEAWPLPNVWCGTSVENQTTAGMRTAELVQIDAAVRFLSVEPLLGPMDLGLGRWIRLLQPVRTEIPFLSTTALAGVYCADSNPHGALSVRATDGTMLGVKPEEFERLPAPEWVILGCESRGTRLGRNAEHYADHARALIEQCAAAGVPVYHKQMPVNGRVSHDPAEWPEWARVREFPSPPRVAVREGDTA